MNRNQTAIKLLVSGGDIQKLSVSRKVHYNIDGTLYDVAGARAAVRAALVANGLLKSCPVTVSMTSGCSAHGDVDGCSKDTKCYWKAPTVGKCMAKPTKRAASSPQKQEGGSLWSFLTGQKKQQGGQKKQQGGQKRQQGGQKRQQGGRNRQNGGGCGTNHQLGGGCWTKRV